MDTSGILFGRNRRSGRAAGMFPGLVAAAGKERWSAGEPANESVMIGVALSSPRRHCLLKLALIQC